MIRNDIKQHLKNENLDQIFLKNRPGIDQPGYRVGEIKINNETITIVWNPKTDVIMDYFYDDVPKKEWFNLDLIYSEKGFSNYKINRLGDVVGIKKKTINNIRFCLGLSNF